MRNSCLGQKAAPTNCDKHLKTLWQNIHNQSASIVPNLIQAILAVLRKMFCCKVTSHPVQEYICINESDWSDNNPTLLSLEKFTSLRPFFNYNPTVTELTENVQKKHGNSSWHINKSPRKRLCQFIINVLDSLNF